MKIGILTFPTAINYGTALQASALCNVLSSDDREVGFLNHRCDHVDSSNSIFDIKNIFDIKYTIAHLINLPIAIKRTNNFKKYAKKYIPLCHDIPSDYDIIVAGSDQIWNYNITGNDFYYFLDFPKNNIRKVSYAGSFGLSSLEEKYHEKIKNLLSDFDYISVREKQAAKIIKDISNKDVPVVVDPTLLLTKEYWKNICKKDSSQQKGGYIFVYTVFNSENIWNYAEELSKKTGLPIKTISYSKLHRHNADYDFTAGPDDWVNYMLNADYVVTNSFHGVAFSINFEKNFFFDMPPAKAGVGSRISDITERYGLTSRNISGENFTPTVDLPDFTLKKELLEKDRQFSFDFIDSFLNPTNESEGVEL